MRDLALWRGWSELVRIGHYHLHCASLHHIPGDSIKISSSSLLWGQELTFPMTTDAERTYISTSKLHLCTSSNHKNISLSQLEQAGNIWELSKNYQNLLLTLEVPLSVLYMVHRLTVWHLKCHIIRSRDVFSTSVVLTVHPSVDPSINLPALYPKCTCWYTTAHYKTSHSYKYVQTYFFSNSIYIHNMYYF